MLIHTNVYPDVDTFGIGVMRALRFVDSPEETGEGCIEMQPAAFIRPTYTHLASSTRAYDLPSDWHTFPLLYCSFPVCPLTAVYEERLCVQSVTFIAKLYINCNMLEVQRNKQKVLYVQKNVKFTLTFSKSLYLKIDI